MADSITIKCDTNDVSDGYHTFGELYEHRIELWIKLCDYLSLPADSNSPRVWRSRLHSDGSVFNGWFILGYGEEAGEQVTYHLPNNRWDDTDFAITLPRAPEFDGHTSADVLERLKLI